MKTITEQKYKQATEIIKEYLSQVWLSKLKRRRNAWWTYKYKIGTPLEVRVCTQSDFDACYNPQECKISFNLEKYFYCENIKGIIYRSDVQIIKKLNRVKK